MAKDELKAGDVISFGRFVPAGRKAEPKGLLWKVLEVAGDNALILSDKLIVSMPYNDSEGETSWQRCTLRKWLNTAFVSSSFSADEARSLCPSDIDGESDLVFILSQEEIEKYLSGEEVRDKGGMLYVPARAAEKLKGRSNRDEYWWLRDVVYVDARFSSMIRHIDHNGYFGFTPSYCERWVRPVCRIKLAAMPMAAPVR